MNESKEELFIEHFIEILKENVRGIHPLSKAPSEFESGKSLAYYEIASLIIECSEIFELPFKNFDADFVNKLL